MLTGVCPMGMPAAWPPHFPHRCGPFLFHSPKSCGPPCQTGCRCPPMLAFNGLFHLLGSISGMEGGR